MRHLFHLLVVSSLCMSYCVTDGDEPAKAPATKKKRIYKQNSSASTAAFLTIFGCRFASWL